MQLKLLFLEPAALAMVVMPAPPNFDWSAPAILAEVDAILAQTTRVWDRVGEISLETATFDNTILPIAQGENELLRRYNVVRWFAAVTSHHEIRAASNEARNRVTNLRKCLLKRKNIAKAMLKVWNDQNKGSCCLDAESIVYLNVLRQEIVDSGLALTDPQAVPRLALLEKEIKEAKAEYMQALDRTQGLWVSVDELQGVPASAVLGWEADQDKRFVPLKVATFEMLCKHADLEETRKKFEIAYDNRAQDTNPALLHRILVLRDEQARLLGYKHYADWHAGDRMISPDRAIAFLEDASKVLSSPVKSRIDAFLAIEASQPRENHSPNSQLDKIYAWDSAYYERLCRQQQYSVDEAALQQYFPFDQVLGRVLQIQGAAFGYTFEKMDAQYPRDVWHEDVEVYKVCKEEGQDEFVGYFYVDAYARDLKFGHRISTYSLINAHHAHDGSRVYPSSVYLANYTKPTIPSESVLLTFRQVVSCFHELGHSIHNFSKTTNFWVLAPPARDFVETPSILLEQFFWHPAILRFVSGRRNGSGKEEKLPDSIIERLIASRFAGEVLAKSRLVHDGLVDLRLHMPASRDDAISMDPVRLYNCLEREICQLASPEDAGMQHDCSKTVSRLRYHIQYAASYYAYILAGAISYDLFETKFRSLMPAIDAVTLEHLISPELKKECKRWQSMILEPGGRLAGRFNWLFDDHLAGVDDIVTKLRELKAERVCTVAACTNPAIGGSTPQHQPDATLAPPPTATSLSHTSTSSTKTARHPRHRFHSAMSEAPLTCDEVLGRGWNDFSGSEMRSLLRAERKKMTETFRALPDDSRPPTKAFDGWYELAPFQLRWQLDEYLDEVPETIDGSALPIPGARAIIAPHAGYAYSGRCSAWAFRCLDLSKAKRVFVLGPTHTYYFRGLALSTFSEYRTPLGALKVDQQTLRDIYAAAESAGAPEVRNIPRRRELDEHSLEMEITFLHQRCEAAFGSSSSADFPVIVPMLVSGDAADEKAIGRLLLPYLRDPANAFVVSSDFCHWGRQFGDYRPYFRGGERARRVNLRDADAPPQNPPIHECIKMLDDEAIAAMETGSHDAFVANLEDTDNSVCGRHPIGAMMAALEMLGEEDGREDKPRFKHVWYDRSALLTDPTQSSVSYVSAYAKF